MWLAQLTSLLLAGSSTTSMMSGKSNSLFLFDFDGVVCDSCNECTVSALRTCFKLGVLPETAPDYPDAALFDKMRTLRPAIEVGWQIPVLLSIVLESDSESTQTKSLPDIIDNYQQLVEQWLEKHTLTETTMIETFGTIRDEWMAHDLDSWLTINTFYPGVAHAMNACSGNAVLVTTKQQRFAIALCRFAKITTRALSDTNIYGLGMYRSKADVIANVRQQQGCHPTGVHFFEDRWPTLVKCLNDTRLEGVTFYLCRWGYVQDAEVNAAQQHPRVRVIDLQDFQRIVADQET